MAATGREKGSGESQETESGGDDNWRNQFASTIKKRNSYDYVDLSGKTWPRPPASPRHGLGPRPRPRPRPARVAPLCPFLSFSIKMKNFQPYKLSQRLVKIPYGIKPYNV